MTTAAAHPFLAGLPGGATERLAGCASEVTFVRGSELFRTGAPADAFYLVDAGRVALEVAPATGEPLVVATVNAGGLVGWSWLIPPHRWQFDARAVDDVHAWRIDATCAHSAMASDDRVARALLERVLHVVAERLGQTRHQLLDVYGHVRAR